MNDSETAGELKAPTPDLSTPPRSPVLLVTPGPDGNNEENDEDGNGVEVVRYIGQTYANSLHSQPMCHGAVPCLSPFVNIPDVHDAPPVFNK